VDRRRPLLVPDAGGRVIVTDAFASESDCAIDLARLQVGDREGEECQVVHDCYSIV
jgi:hypothetical protein